MGQVFQFKQFAVDQNNVPMRINTDGVLLGAKAEANPADAILDIGTGTGVIALMLAQRFPEAKVWAVEIDELAAETASMNFQNSPFSERMTLLHADIFHWKTDQKFDLIVSNPPFYINSLHNPDQRMKIAKHTDDHFFKGLLQFAGNRLSAHGRLEIIVPIELQVFLTQEAAKQHLHLVAECHIRSFNDSESFRCILHFSRYPENKLVEDFVIYKDRSVYSDAYNHLLQPFFLAF